MPSACAVFDSVVKTQFIAGESNEAFQSHLLETYNAQARLVRSLKAVAVVHAVRGPKFGARAGKSKEIAGFIDFEQPEWLHITGVVPPLGTRVFELASDGRKVQLLAPDHNTTKFFVGALDALPNGSDADDLTHPREFIEALRWQVGSLRKTAETQFSPAAPSATLDLNLPPRDEKSVEGKLQFDPRSGAVNSLQLFGADGELLTELRYTDWRTLGDAASGSPQSCFPRRVQLIQPVAGLEMDIQFLELTLNPRILKSTFHITAPRGVPVVHLNSRGTEKTN